jgi:hypothetical protein
MTSEPPGTDTAAEVVGRYESLTAVPGNTRVEILTLNADWSYEYESFDRSGSPPPGPVMTSPGDISDFPPDPIVNRLQSRGMWSIVDDSNALTLDLVDTSGSLQGAFLNMTLAVIEDKLVVRSGEGAEGREFVKVGQSPTSLR